MKPFDKEKVKAGCRALERWFISQEITSANAGVIMAYMVACALVQQAKSAEHLEEGYEIYGKMLHAMIVNLWSEDHPIPG